jgi:chemotaxis protein methyltransferase WspC
VIKLYDDLAEYFEKEIGLEISTLGDKIFRRAIESTLNKYGSDEKDFLSGVKGKMDEYYELLGRLTVSETWFMREEKAFEDCYSFIEKKVNSRINILSIPCSTGEEAYSALIYLTKKGICADRLNIYGIDINPASLELAKRAVFKEYSFRNKNIDCRDCFEELGDKIYRLVDNYSGRVKFIVGNLLDTGLADRLPKFDVIFCRNVLIYMTEAARAKAITMLSKLLKNQGIILSGHTELMTFQSNGYSKVSGMSFAMEIPDKRASKKIETIVPIAIKHKEIKKIPKREAEDTREDNNIEQIIRLANSGHLAEAERKCNEYLEVDELDFMGYYLLGMIREASKNLKESIINYEKAIYLNPGHYESLLQLSLIYKSLGEMEKADQYMVRAEKSMRPA